jgi:hypothetical protein
MHASKRIDGEIADLADWRGKVLADIRGTSYVKVLFFVNRHSFAA